ncbi:hypothetical protein Pan189_34860 [Stratiformator vulcanicus]|uniref:Uncharacterized protein n=1 Tax=Stratiformator vulcanicus TaxID=2527980 RepID=A0A517R5C6_9PLAN|nr:hypothetical protein Pan189_34860 [Stratiformator vulcanicus]
MPPPELWRHRLVYCLEFETLHGDHWGRRKRRPQPPAALTGPFSIARGCRGCVTPAVFGGLSPCIACTRCAKPVGSANGAKSARASHCGGDTHPATPSTSRGSWEPRTNQGAKRRALTNPHPALDHHFSESDACCGPHAAATGKERITSRGRIACGGFALIRLLPCAASFRVSTYGAQGKYLAYPTRLNLEAP